MTEDELKGYQDKILLHAGAKGVLAHERDVVVSLRDRIAELEDRLEMDHHFELAADGVTMVRVEIPPEERSFLADGIECRDGTIALQDECIKRSREALDKVREAIGFYVRCKGNVNREDVQGMVYDIERALASTQRPGEERSDTEPPLAEAGA